MALGLTQLLHFLGGKGGRSLGLTTLPPSYTDCLEFLGVWSAKGLSKPAMG